MNISKIPNRTFKIYGRNMVFCINDVSSSLKRRRQLKKNTESVEINFKNDKEIRTRKTKKRIIPPEYTYIYSDNKITRHYIELLKTHKAKSWEPFVCKVAKIVMCKKKPKNKTGHYILYLDDKSPKAPYRTYLSYDYIDIIQKKILKKGDLIRVSRYTCTKMSRGPSVIIILDFKIIPT